MLYAAIEFRQCTRSFFVPVLWEHFGGGQHTSPVPGTPPETSEPLEDWFLFWGSFLTGACVSLGECEG